MRRRPTLAHMLDRAIDSAIRDDVVVVLNGDEPAIVWPNPDQVPPMLREWCDIDRVTRRGHTVEVMTIPDESVGFLLGQMPRAVKP